MRKRTRTVRGGRTRATRTLAPSGHSGGSGFDPLSDSPLSDPKPEPETKKTEQEEGGGTIIGWGLLALGTWALSKWMGGEDE